MPQRFDTHFFAASAPSGAAPAPDDHEIDTVEWITPETAIERGRDGTWSMSPPTLGTLDDLSGHSSVHAILTALSAHTVAPVRPRVRIGEDSLDVVLPGEVGFDDLSDLPPDPSIAARLRQVARPRGSRDAG